MRGGFLKFDIFCEIQKAKPWVADQERVLFEETLAQARLADELGFRCWWEVEHHGAAEFSWSSAPEVFLTYLSQHTRRIHLGHAGVLAPFRINHPLRVAERAAMLDVISGGRLELGLARSGGNEFGNRVRLFAREWQTRKPADIEASHGSQIVCRPG